MHLSHPSMDLLGCANTVTMTITVLRLDLKVDPTSRVLILNARLDVRSDLSQHTPRMPFRGAYAMVCRTSNFVFEGLVDIIDYLDRNITCEWWTRIGDHGIASLLSYQSGGIHRRTKENEVGAQTRRLHVPYLVKVVRGNGKNNRDVQKLLLLTPQRTPEAPAWSPSVPDPCYSAYEHCTVRILRPSSLGLSRNSRALLLPPWKQSPRIPEGRAAEGLKRGGCTEQLLWTGMLLYI
ncbi:hypothetical protein F5141DRAFT_1218856 [Pisolithus sp. B1]|nr:hypothetical protein F5141DRAFT_1218856 [Pisolithus sp. B1]